MAQAHKCCLVGCNNNAWQGISDYCETHYMERNAGTMTDAEFIEDMRAYRQDHQPDGYPCVQTWQIDRLIEIIDRLTSDIDAIRG